MGPAARLVVDRRFMVFRVTEIRVNTS